MAACAPMRKKLIPWLLLPMLAAMAWWLWPSQPEPQPAQADGPAPTAKAEAAASSASPGARDLALAPQASTTPSPQQMLEARWCEQSRHWPAHDARLLDPEQPLLQELRLQRQTQRLQALRQLGSERALALADWLDPDPAARSRLQAEALESKDPAVLSLTLQTACADDACRQSLAKRWLELQPSNLYPLLSVHQSLDTPLEAWTDAVLQADHANNYREEWFELLRSLPTETSRGPADALSSIERFDRAAAWSVPLGLSRALACRRSDTALAARCAAAAERLWNLADDPLEAQIALRMVASQPALHAQWGPRSQQWQALQQLLQDDVNSAEREPWFTEALSCRGFSAAAKLYERHYTGAHLKHLRERLAREDQRLLLARYRAGDGVDPLRP